MKTMTIPEFHAALHDQKAPSREDIAFKCVMCGTVQSARSFINAGAGKTMDDVDRWLGFSCVGRFTKAGPHKKGTPPGKSCDWTLGGLFTLHCLEVVDADGKKHPHFEPASPDETSALARTFHAQEETAIHA